MASSQSTSPTSEHAPTSSTPPHSSTPAPFGKASATLKKKEHATLVYACDFCRSIKRKCIRLPQNSQSNKPQCEACVSKGINCVFSPRKRKKLNPSPSPIASDNSDTPVTQLIRLPQPSPSPKSENSLFVSELQATLTLHLLQHAFRYSPKKLLTEALERDIVAEFIASGRNPKNMGRWGPITIAVMIVEGAKHSTHPAILSMKAPTNPALIGDMSTYSRQRDRTINSLIEKVRTMCDEEQISRYPSFETIAVLLEACIMFSRSWYHPHVAYAKEVFGIALDQYRLLIQAKKPMTRPLERLGRSLGMLDVILSRHFDTPMTISDSELRSSMFRYSEIDAPFYLSALPLLCTIQPTAEALASDDFLDVSVTALGRTVADLVYHALRSPDQHSAGILFHEALKTTMSRKEWMTKQREARDALMHKMPSNKLVDLLVWRHNEVIQYPYHLFHCFAKLRKYLAKLDQEVEPELAVVVEEFEKEINSAFTFFANWYKQLVFERTLCAEDFDSRLLFKLCGCLYPIINEKASFSYFKTYLQNAHLDTTVDRRQIFFWIQEGLKAGSFYKSIFAVWAMEIGALLEETASEQHGFIKEEVEDFQDIDISRLF